MPSLETGHKLLLRIRKELKRGNICADPENYHPVVELAKIGADETIAPAIRFAANQVVAQYVTPKPAPVDFEGKAVAQQIQVVVAGYASNSTRNGTPPQIEDKSRWQGDA